MDRGRSGTAKYELLALVGTSLCHTWVVLSVRFLPIRAMDQVSAALARAMRAFSLVAESCRVLGSRSRAESNSSVN